MPFNLNFHAQNNEDYQLQLGAGEILFVLGANGTGKSSLMFLFNQNNQGRTRKISAHRQTWMNSDTLDMTPANKIQTEINVKNEDQNQHSRYRDTYAAQRASMTIYELIDGENVRARKIAAAYDAGEMDRLAEAASVEAPIAVINELLQQSNIPIKITIRANERVMASKNGGPEYSAAQLSDGERSALLIAGNVLTAPEGTLLIIDEPERHLHRSIISPLLNQLFRRRPDCGFVISTHDHDLPLGNPESRTLLLRSCKFNDQNNQNCESDDLPANAPIDDVLKRDLLGARRKILFVEGTENSLDKPLYSLVFPMVSVIPKGNCHKVEQAVLGARAAEELLWIKAFGITDNDGLDANQIAVKREKGIYTLPYYSVEAIYFHPRIIEKIALRQASVFGDDASQMAGKAMASGVVAIKDQTDRLAIKATKKAVRKSIMNQIPNDNNLLQGENIQIVNDSSTIYSVRKHKLDNAVVNCNWEEILQVCPIRESNALGNISSALRFTNRQDYEKAVMHLLTKDKDTLEFIRNLFGDLTSKILD